MATDEALAYLVAFSVPVWLLIEQLVSLLRSRPQHVEQIDRDHRPAVAVREEQTAVTERMPAELDASPVGGGARAGAHEVAQKAA